MRVALHTRLGPGRKVGYAVIPRDLDVALRDAACSGDDTDIELVWELLS